jgi:hypothetical protein
VAASPSDPNFQRILTVLSNLGAGPEESLAIISAYTNRPAAEPADSRRVNPNDQVVPTPNACVEPARRVLLGADMPKPHRLRELRGNGSLRVYCDAWYAMYRRYVWVDGEGKNRRKTG